jgi:uncharacterized membrane protein
MEIISSLLEWNQSLPQKEQYMILFALFCAVFLIYRLARSEDVNGTGRVIVKYHSPFTWLKRFNDQVADNRAGYSDKVQGLLSVLRVVGILLRSLFSLLLSLVLFAMAYFGKESDHFWYILIAAVFFLLYFIMQVRSARSNDNPFRQDKEH